MKKLFLTFIVLSLWSSLGWSGECKIHVTRKACPGKEMEAMAPYGGKSESEEKKEVADAPACLSWAEKSALIVHKGSLATKKVTAFFAGKELETTFEGKKDCK